uniref:Putative ionotropic receptor 75d n=1 Tax=Conopomorpha sinensis TaxID=940481 RepID=A0A3S7SGQ2_9NEOP|nr:putative ionotropic receptor 75d [Conopomorpha sinensis]
MDLVNYLLSYFAARNVFYLCAFVCWPPDQIVKLQRDAPLYNIRVSILSFSDFRALHPVANGFQRDGILLDVNCPGSEDVVQHASQTRAFNLRFTWILLDNSPYNESKMNDYLDGVTVLADADVLWFSTNKVIEMYRLKPKEPLILLEHNWTSSATQQEMALCI